MLCDHYQKEIRKSAGYTAQIIEVLPENTTATMLQKKETKRKLKLQTAFPFGLNDKIGKKTKVIVI